MSPLKILPGVYLLDMDGQKRLATRSTDHVPVYGERILEGYRFWDPFRSKLAGFLHKNKGKGLNISRDAKVLYLGAATGTTVSHISDIVAEGLVYAVEFSPRSMRDLIRLCEQRDNIVPILADAAKPEKYSSLVEVVDLVYQDIAQRNQAEIASINCQRYLKSGGDLLLMMKTRSIDVTASPAEVLNLEIKNLKGLDLLEIMDLLPFHQDHWAVQARRPA
jgi:fibrillarin-like pre-rRNA processing protein